MPKERSTLFGMLSGDEPGPFARIRHNLSGEGEGEWGEKCIEKLLKNRVSGVQLFRNVYVPVGERTTELDIVMAARTGLFVFESKAYGGEIYGEAEEMMWTQALGRVRNSFYNPIKQNANHCRYLARALWIEEARIASFVVFENRADLSGVAPRRGSNYIVCNRRDLPQALTKALSKRRKAFSAGLYQRICGKLKEWQDADCKERHIRQVQERMYGDVCPVCGKKLTRRTGRNGPFTGCTGYPQCRYTRDF